MFLSDKLGQAVSPALISQRYESVFCYFSDALQSIPLFIVNGNHEGEWNCGEQNCEQTSNPVVAASLRKKFYPNPEPNFFYSGNTAHKYPSVGIQSDYYAWQWGNTFFLVLDPFWYTIKAQTGQGKSGWGWTLGLEQYTWLGTTLSESSTSFKVVFIHNLLGGSWSTDPTEAAFSFQGIGGVVWSKYFEWGGWDTTGMDAFHTNRPDWPSTSVPIHELLVTYNVNAVFKGHDHVYYRMERDGIMYSTLPHAGCAVSEAAENSKVTIGYSSTELLSMNFVGGYASFSVSSGAITVSYISYDGILQDSYSLTT